TEPLKLGDDYSVHNRSTFKETIDFISTECDRAEELLFDKGDMEMGRATKGAALALKSRLLLFAASDLTADGDVENELVGYINPNRTELWEKAKQAAEDVINIEGYALDDFGAPDKE